ncbi:zf-U1-domain-containing protein [Sporormia fimetaria CBS 119925]|uniref:Zf-U1-domain-containing protein n=1 Tax=Sporormia fimetaria CBS 119925 TaxID=1340428 RepID=A0A6A6V3M7_9PLEO|nr:zf-U1-domain-containing protein [Sporormia fimetaria CBS 119925]
MPKYKYNSTFTLNFANSPHSSVGFLSPDARSTLTTLGDYCDVYLTHDSMSVRKAHNAGRNHLRNVQAYYERASRLLSSPALWRANDNSQRYPANRPSRLSTLLQ